MNSDPLKVIVLSFHKTNHGDFQSLQIPNPDWFEDLHPHNVHPISAVGFELLSNSGDKLLYWTD